MEAILFDLDGTLVDSAADIWTATNRALGSLDLPERTLPEIRAFIGDGVVKLMERAIGPERLVAAPSLDIDLAVAGFREHYDACLVDTTTFFPGITELLGDLHAPSSLVSNKPEAMCRRITDALGITQRFTVIAGGDTYPVPKPDPLPFLETARRMGLHANRCLVVGDGRQDMLAGRAAGCRTIGVAWGQNDPATLIKAGADEVAGTVDDLRMLIRSRLSDA